jgi:hypothetical protein
MRREEPGPLLSASQNQNASEDLDAVTMALSTSREWEWGCIRERERERERQRDTLSVLRSGRRRGARTSCGSLKDCHPHLPRSTMAETKPSPPFLFF